MTKIKHLSNYSFALLCLLFLTATTGLRAQSTLDFTMDDINGNSHNLHTYLESGKAVVLDFFQYECGPCWNYHETNALKNFYSQYGPDGNNTAMVLQLCIYPDAQMNQLTGDNGGNWNWIEGVEYPTIVIPENLVNTLLSHYNSWGTPTLTRICPDKMYESSHPFEVDFGDLPGLQNWVAQECGLNATSTDVLVSDAVVVYPNPVQNTLHVTTKEAFDIDLTITDMLGRNCGAYHITGSQQIEVGHLAAGMYHLFMETEKGKMVKKIIVN